MSFEGGESRMYGYQFRSHDGTGLFRARSVDEYGSGGWYMDYRRS